VDTFRDLLAMSPAELNEALTNRTAESRKLILAKIREYKTLRPEERDLQLRKTELWWYLMPVMSGSPTNRAEQLAAIPTEYRNLIAERLAKWDALDPAFQKQFLSNAATVRYFTGSVEQKIPINERSPTNRANLEKGMERWRELSEQDRQNIIIHFNQFFSLPPAQKLIQLQKLPSPEKNQMAKTLRGFDQLKPEERSRCIQNFERYLNLSEEEKQQFLRNTERWTLMSPEERKAWRALIHRVSPEPPLPPGLRPGPQQQSGPSVVTGGN
jgi:hypothetical protein